MDRLETYMIKNDVMSSGLLYLPHLKKKKHYLMKKAITKGGVTIAA